MKIELTPELEELRAEVRRFTERELEPLARVIDSSGAVPQQAWDVMREAGYLGMRLPEAYGGTSAALSQMCIVLEEFSRSHRVLTGLIDATSGLTPSAFVRHGSPAQRDKYVRKLATGEMRAAFALTEPGAGSDSAAISTRAEKVDGGWKINGRKHFISGGRVADVLMVTTVTDAQKRARGGITALLVEKGTPGFSVTRVDTTIGSEAWKLAELTLRIASCPTAR
jgi:acyl-CoA dehydrogenase